jgi:hypothetical protein
MKYQDLPRTLPLILHLHLLKQPQQPQQPKLLQKHKRRNLKQRLYQRIDPRKMKTQTNLLILPLLKDNLQRKIAGPGPSGERGGDIIANQSIPKNATDQKIKDYGPQPLLSPLRTLRFIAVVECRILHAAPQWSIARLLPLKLEPKTQQMKEHKSNPHTKKEESYRSPNQILIEGT